MNPMMLAGLDILVVAVLLYAVYYMRIVAKATLVIRQGKSEMQQVLKEMTLAIGKAEETINGMKRLADDRGKFLQKQMDAANTLAEELKFINQAADQVAQRLERGTAGPNATKNDGKTDTKARPALSSSTPPSSANAPSSVPFATTPSLTASAPAAAPFAGASKSEKDLAAALARRQTELKQGEGR